MPGKTGSPSKRFFLASSISCPSDGLNSKEFYGYGRISILRKDNRLLHCVNLGKYIPNHFLPRHLSSANYHFDSRARNHVNRVVTGIKHLHLFVHPLLFARRYFPKPGKEDLYLRNQNNCRMLRQKLIKMQYLYCFMIFKIED